MTTFVTRDEWGARPPRSTPSAITSEGTTGHWEGGGIWGGPVGSHDRCATLVRGIQAYHMDANGWTDIAYNAVACPHDYLFEGRGPDRRSAANGTNTANSRSAVVCYLGGVGDEFPDAAKRAMLSAAWYLHAGLIWGHRDWYATQCPGDEIYGWIHAGAPSPDPTPQPQPPHPEDHMIFHYAQLEESPTVYLVNMATKPRPVVLFADVDFWAAREGHTIATWADTPDVMGADGQGQKRTGMLIKKDNVRARALFGFT